MTANEQNPQPKVFNRFNWHHRLQHIMMFTSFFILAFTGIPIKYSYTAWALKMTYLFGGFDTMFLIHQIGAVIMLASSVYHLMYLVIYPLITRKISLATAPSLKDVSDLIQNMQYLLGVSKDRPRFDRYSYKEKFDYWAVFWGMFIMGGSGLMLWYPQIAAQFFPRWIIDSARMAHSDEAMLAIIVIFVWHFYNVHFSPMLFPLNPTFWTGKLSRRLMEHEHPVELDKLTGTDHHQVYSGGKESAKT
ncbi:MAG: formate dehydrogenase subunit gamma [Bacillota bacterium]